MSAGLTFFILLTFAAIVGKLAQERLLNDFHNELQARANQVAFSISLNPETGNPTIPLEGTAIGSEAVRVTFANGTEKNLNDTDLPAPNLQEIVRFGDYDVATQQVTTSLLGAGPTYVQVGRRHTDLDATISRLWFFLAVGVAGGTILATLAGLAVAGRAMRPIAALTNTAREIASTRDPARTMPKPEADDEVAELARTLDEMLRELDAARTEAQQMVNAQREFVADASHELRTPLTSILANLELLQHRFESMPSEDGEESEIVESALRSSRRMRRLVADLLILARADAGRESARRPCDLGAIAEAAAAEVRPVAPDHSIEVTAASVAVEGNPDELHRLAVNLIDNGARHTPDGSTITITVEERDGDAVLVVADDGPGLPAGLGDQAFSRFVRGNGPADVAADSGTGLGLSIVKAVATAHGGSVEATASNHGGAAFEVVIPGLGRPLKATSKLSRVL